VSKSVSNILSQILTEIHTEIMSNLSWGYIIPSNHDEVEVWDEDENGDENEDE